MSSFVAEETDMYCCPLHEHLTPDNEVVALNEVYDNQCTDKNGQFISGTQLLDFCKECKIHCLIFIAYL